MQNYQYASTISGFFNKSESEIVHILTENNEFSSIRRTTINSWHEEVRSIRKALSDYKEENGSPAKFRV